jgi:hypothetical protein
VSWPLARDVELPVIELNIRWDRADLMLPTLIEVARRHEKVLYDPQNDKIHLPPRLVEEHLTPRERVYTALDAPAEEDVQIPFRVSTGQVLWPDRTGSAGPARC